MGKPKQGSSEVNTIATPIVDRLVALELSANLAHENRLDFARSFSAEIAASCWDAVHGGRVSFTPSIVRYGEEPHARTNEVWTATDPSLDGLIVRLTTDGGPAGKSTRELVKFTPGEPDPALFQMPAGRTITSRNGQAYYCDVKPKTLPTTAPTAQHPTP